MIHAIALLAATARSTPRSDRADDLALVERHRAGDTTAFAEIFRAHVDDVFRRITRILGPIPEREDLVQDVFLGLHRTLPTFRGDARLSTLIHRIAINRACEHLRRNARRPLTLVDGAFFDDLSGHDGSPADLTSWRQQLATVFECLGKLKPKKRIAYVLRVVDGLSFEEIADLADATPEAVAKRVQAAQRELEGMLARRGT